MELILDKHIDGLTIHLNRIEANAMIEMLRIFTQNDALLTLMILNEIKPRKISVSSRYKSLSEVEIKLMEKYKEKLRSILEGLELYQDSDSPLNEFGIAHTRR